MPILRAIQRRSDPRAFAWRHPLISISLLTFIIGIIWDAAQEILLTRAQFLTYSHVIEFGSIDVGKYSQFPLMMASVLITIVVIPASVLLYRDDTGRSQAEKIAQRLRLHARRPKLATFLVMAIVLNIAMISFSSTFWLVRATGAASIVACPWPYPQDHSPPVRPVRGRLRSLQAGQQTSPWSPTAAIQSDSPARSQASQTNRHI
jgi:hypothetical protein